MNTPEQLIEVIHDLHSRGWAPATAGNYSIRLSSEPLRLLVTPSGIDKGTATVGGLLEIDGNGDVVKGSGRPSAETLIHVAIYEKRQDAEAILHTHSIWNTLLSYQGNGFALEGYELLKALEGIKTHEHTEHIPILPNSQEMGGFSDTVRDLCDRHPDMHAFLMRGHGLYTWGRGLFEAKRHVEALEFLFEVEARRSLPTDIRTGSRSS